MSFTRTMTTTLFALAILTAPAAIAAQVDGPVCEITVSADFLKREQKEGLGSRFEGQQSRRAFVGATLGECSDPLEGADPCFAETNWSAVVEGWGSRCDDLNMIGPVGLTPLAGQQATFRYVGDGFDENGDPCPQPFNEGTCADPRRYVCYGTMQCSNVSGGIGGTSARLATPMQHCELRLTRGIDGKPVADPAGIRATLALEYLYTDIEQRRSNAAKCDAGEPFHRRFQGSLIGGTAIEGQH